MSDDVKMARTIYARASKVECPHCGADVEGWYSDPRGIETKCDECGESFKVAADAEILLK